MGILEGKTCIVTGAAGSLGLASVRLFVQEGARVMLVDRDRDTLGAALKTLPEGRATAMLADVSDAKDTAAYVSATVARWGPIDVLPELPSAAITSPRRTRWPSRTRTLPCFRCS